jgi:hypothetical protein
MRIVSVIQIGDIHFPESRNAVVGDVKDRGLTENLCEMIVGKSLRHVFRKLATVRAKRDVCGLFICGDLTTGGKLPEYRECVEYLVSNIGLADPKRVPPEHWHVVPGNHDVPRKTLKPSSSPFPDLFRPLEKEWSRQFEAGRLTVERVRQSRLSHEGCSIDLFSLNSCVGCGEWRRIPQTIQAAITDVIASQFQGAEDSIETFKTLAEQLDAPAFHQGDITALCEAIESLDRKTVPMVLAHHGLLPQATPRLDIYTEMLNSGMLRSRLASLGRPVIYCHGHIHTDPIEVVSNADKEASKVVIVAAPEAVKGFNLLNVFFGKNEHPIGLEIVKYRLNNDASVEAGVPIRISLCLQPRTINATDSELMRFVDACKVEFEPIKQVRDRLSTGSSPTPNFATLRGRLVEAEWHSLVELENRATDDPKELRVRKVKP